MINICAAQKCPQFSLADSQHAPIQLFGNPKTNTSYGYCLLFTTFHLSKKIVRHRQNTDRLKRRNHICNQQLKYINGDTYMTGKRISLEQQLSGIFINSFANTQQHFIRLLTEWFFFFVWHFCAVLVLLFRLQVACQQQCKRLYLFLFRSIAMQTSSLVMSLSIHDFQRQHRNGKNTETRFK